MPEAPGFRSVSVGTNRSSAGTWVKEMSAMDSQHQQEKVFTPVCFFKKKNSAAYFLLTFCSGNVIFSLISMIINMHVLTRLRAEAEVRRRFKLHAIDFMRRCVLECVS